MSDFNAETELNFEKRQAHRANKRNQSQNPYPRIDVCGLSCPPRPPRWHHPLTCSFSEYGLLRTTGMLPFPHRSLKTRSFSTPRGRGLCDLPSRSLKGKARGGEESVAGGTSWWCWPGNPESVHNFHRSPTRVVRGASELWMPRLLLRRVVSNRWEGRPIVKHKGGLIQAGTDGWPTPVTVDIVSGWPRHAFS